MSLLNDLIDKLQWLPGIGRKTAQRLAFFLQKMEKILEPKKMTKVTEGLTIRVKGMKGPLEEGYEEKIDKFAQEIFDKM